MGKRDPVLLAKLRSMGVGTRGIVWRLGQAITWAALIHGRAGDAAASAEWYAKAQLMADALGADTPPLPARRDDRVKGAAEALGFVVRTVPSAMTSAIEPYGDDHVGLFECALKLGLIDFIGTGGGEMLDAIATGVRRAAERGRLPARFHERLAAIVAAVGSDRAVALIVDCYAETAQWLAEELAAARADGQTLAPSPAAKPVVPATAAEPAAKPAGGLARAIPDTPAGFRLRSYLCGTSFAAAVTLHPHPEDRERAEASWRASGSEASALGVTLPALPPLAGERRQDWARALEFLIVQTEQIAGTLRERFGPAVGALFIATVKLTLFAQRYRAAQPDDALGLVEPLVAELTRAELPAEHWGSLLAVVVARPDDDGLDRWYREVRQAIRDHLERALG